VQSLQAKTSPLEQTINNINAFNFSELRDVCTRIGACRACRPLQKRRI
jgi:hypothetical protein